MVPHCLIGLYISLTMPEKENLSATHMTLGREEPLRQTANLSFPIKLMLPVQPFPKKYFA
jgi:hypothetical protein